MSTTNNMFNNDESTNDGDSVRYPMSTGSNPPRVLPPAPGQPGALNPGLYPPESLTAHVPRNSSGSTAGVVHRLMNPHESLYSEDMQTVKLTKTWAVGIVGGPEHFEEPGLFQHWILMHGSDLRNRGQELGLSKEMFEWLTSTADEIEFPASHFQ